jgi:general secretion pathway protein A
MAALWALHSSEPYGRDPCAGARVAALECVRDRAQTWDQLAALDRPLLLDMVTPDRFAAGAVLLGLDGRNTWVVDAEGGVSEVPLSSLAGGWSGDYRYLWQPPAGFDKPLSRGDRGAVVREVAALFARLDGQSQALTDDLFNQSLEQRVKLFQRASGLEDDGVVGAQTLLKLNAALGVDPSARALRQSLAATAGPLE